MSRRRVVEMLRRLDEAIRKAASGGAYFERCTNYALAEALGICVTEPVLGTHDMMKIIQGAGYAVDVMFPDSEEGREDAGAWEGRYSTIGTAFYPARLKTLIAFAHAYPRGTFMFGLGGRSHGPGHNVILKNGRLFDLQEKAPDRRRIGGDYGMIVRIKDRPAKQPTARKEQTGAASKLDAAVLKVVSEGGRAGRDVGRVVTYLGFDGVQSTERTVQASLKRLLRAKKVRRLDPEWKGDVVRYTTLPLR